MKTVHNVSAILFLFYVMTGLAQVTPEAEEEYYFKSQELSLFLADHPQKMDSILGEIDKLDTLLKGKKESKKVATETVTRIVLQYRSAMCEGYCNVEIDVWSAAKRVTRIPGTIDGWPSDLSVKRETKRLKQKDWKEILASLSWEEVKSLPDTMGCPGCEDGAVAILTVSTANDSHKITFEGPDPPETIQALTRMIIADVFKK